MNISQLSLFSLLLIQGCSFLKYDLEKIKIIEGHFREIMLTLGLDLTDDSLRGTPNRVAKMYIEEIFIRDIPGIHLNQSASPFTRQFWNKSFIDNNVINHVCWNQIERKGFSVGFSAT